MLFTMAVFFLSTVMVTCLIGVAVLPMFDRRAPLSVAGVPKEPRAAPPRSA
jgi:hypothetical protein